MNKLRSIILLLWAVSHTGEAKKVTIKCEPPAGQTVVLSKQKGVMVEPKLNRTPNQKVEPIFVMDLANSSKILVLWGQRDESQSAKQTQLAATEATVLRASISMVTAVESVGDTVLWLYSFYPEDGVAYITRHKYSKDFVSASYFAARCTYTDSG